MYICYFVLNCFLYFKIIHQSQIKQVDDMFSSIENSNVCEMIEKESPPKEETLDQSELSQYLATEDTDLSKSIKDNYKLFRTYKYRHSESNENDIYENFRIFKEKSNDNFESDPYNKEIHENFQSVLNFSNKIEKLRNNENYDFLRNKTKFKNNLNNQNDIHKADRSVHKLYEGYKNEEIDPNIDYSPLMGVKESVKFYENKFFGKKGLNNNYDKNDAYIAFRGIIELKKSVHKTLEVNPNKGCNLLGITELDNTYKKDDTYIAFRGIIELKGKSEDVEVNPNNECKDFRSINGYKFNFKNKEVDHEDDHKASKSVMEIVEGYEKKEANKKVYFFEN